MKTLGCVVLMLGWVVVGVAIFDLAYEWVRAWFEPDPERQEWMTRIYQGGMRRMS